MLPLAQSANQILNSHLVPNFLLSYRFYQPKYSPSLFFFGTVSRSIHRGLPHLVGPVALVRLIRCYFPHWLACGPGYDKLGNMLASVVNISALSGLLYSFRILFPREQRIVAYSYLRPSHNRATLCPTKPQSTDLIPVSASTNWHTSEFRFTLDNLKIIIYH